MQSITVEGYMAAVPTIRAAQGDGRKRATFRLGETTKFRRGDGTPGERTTWFDCVCFNEGTAENYVGAHGRKGSRVVVQGHVEENAWTGKDGVRHYDQTLVVEDIRISGARATGSQPESEAARPATRPAARKPRAAQAGAGATAAPELDDQIPF